MKILNFGSLNIDIVYNVPHIVKPGETIASTNLSIHAGGKGANQSVALSKAGAEVFHAGKIGEDGKWLLDKLQFYGVNTDYISIDKCKTGNALIQVSGNGENSIVLYGGGNQEITRNEIESVLENFKKGDLLLLQNEITLIPEIITIAHKKGIIIYFNPAPFDRNIFNYPLDRIDVFIVNEIEGSGLSGGITEPERIMNKLTSTYKGKEIILTLGRDGVMYGKDDKRFCGKAKAVKTIDTTAAGDTFIGFYMAETIRGNPIEKALDSACKASAITVSNRGAMDSIPYKKDL